MCILVCRPERSSMIARLLCAVAVVSIAACARPASSDTPAVAAARDQTCRRQLTVVNGSNNRLFLFEIIPGVQPRIVQSVEPSDSTSLLALPNASYRAKFDASQAAPWVDARGGDPRVRLRYGC
jgi:hypothetical protein